MLPSPSAGSTLPWPATRSGGPGPSGVNSMPPAATPRPTDARSTSTGSPPPPPAPLPGLPLRLGDGASAHERGGEITSLNYAIELRSWMAAPDAEQSALRDAALDSLRAGGRGQPV